ncbi:MAG TPA: universal stress protein [Kofleriaceae bacterium]|nr:universal stress protein [Kofleriaceae bacterium]
MNIAEGTQVVIAYDFSSTSEIAFERGIELAARSPRHVLHVITVVDDAHPVAELPTSKVDYAYTEKVQARVAEKLTAAFAARAPEVPVRFIVHVRIGKAADQILALAADVSAELVIVGSHGFRGVDRLLFGSVSEAVVRAARCPVLVVRAKTYPPVDLVEVVDATEHQRYVRPHRYSYNDERVLHRSSDWTIW